MLNKFSIELLNGMVDNKTFHKLKESFSWNKKEIILKSQALIMSLKL